MARFFQGGFPFTKTFDALEPGEKSKYLSLDVMLAVQAGYPDLANWSQPFDSGEENYSQSVEAGQAILQHGVSPIPVGFHLADYDAITMRDEFVAWWASQVKLTAAIQGRHIMLLPEAWRHEVGQKPHKGAELKVFLDATCDAICDGLEDAPQNFRTTLEMLSPHELRTINNLAVICQLVDLIREKLQSRGRSDIYVGITVDSAHLFYPRRADRPRMDVAFGGNSVPLDTLLDDFGRAVAQGYVGALHHSLEYSRSHPCKPSIDGESIPLDRFLGRAVGNGFEGPIDVEVMLPTHDVIKGSGLEGTPAEPNWDVNTPEEPIIAGLKAQRPYLGLDS